jgi:hypothetical protein
VFEVNGDLADGSAVCEGKMSKGPRKKGKSGGLAFPIYTN